MIQLCFLETNIPCDSATIDFRIQFSPDNRLAPLPAPPRVTIFNLTSWFLDIYISNRQRVAEFLVICFWTSIMHSLKSFNSLSWVVSDLFVYAKTDFHTFLELKQTNDWRVSEIIQKLLPCLRSLVSWFSKEFEVGYWQSFYLGTSRKVPLLRLKFFNFYSGYFKRIKSKY